jgi:hypothetical protein
VASKAGYVSKDTAAIILNTAQANAYGLSEALKMKGYVPQ